MRANAIKGLVGAFRRTLCSSPQSFNLFGVSIPLSSADHTDGCSDKPEKAGVTEEEAQSFSSQIKKLDKARGTDEFQSLSLGIEKLEKAGCTEEMEEFQSLGTEESQSLSLRIENLEKARGMEEFQSLGTEESQSLSLRIENPEKARVMEEFQSLSLRIEKPDKTGETEECLSSRIEMLEKGESVASAFKSHMGDGFPIHSGDVFHTINLFGCSDSDKSEKAGGTEEAQSFSSQIKKLDKAQVREEALSFHSRIDKLEQSRGTEESQSLSLRIQKPEKARGMEEFQSLSLRIENPEKARGMEKFQSWSLRIEKPDKTGGTEECLSSRIEKLEKGESVASAFKSYMGDGFPIHSEDVFQSINRLRKFRDYKRALQVMEWVFRERPYKPKELDYCCLLEFTARVHGVSRGESLFLRIPSEFQKDLLYNSLVLACLEMGKIRLSLAYMKKMRELGYSISYLVFNRLITLHSCPSRRKHIPKTLAQMKADKVPRDVSTFNILLKIEANDHNIQGLVKVFGDMKLANVEANEVTYSILATANAVARLYTAAEAYVEAIEACLSGKNWNTWSILMTLYGYLGKQKDLERVWGVIQGLPYTKTKNYVLAIEAFGKIGDIKRAEELWMEMESEKGLKFSEQFNSLIYVYCKHGLVTKATGLYKDMEKTGCKPDAMTFRHLALGCLNAGLVKEAIKTLELGKDFPADTKVRKSTPWLETTYSIIEGFAERGDLVNTEKLFMELQKVNYTRYTFVYNALIKAYVKAKVYDPDLLTRMIQGGTRPDSETYSLLKLNEQQLKK